MFLKVKILFFLSFFTWLVSLGGIIGETFVESVTHWIETKLDPYKTMWLSYHMLYICDMEGRTTSIAGSLHSSMKNGYDTVSASGSSHAFSKEEYIFSCHFFYVVSEFGRNNWRNICGISNTLDQN